MQAAADKPFLSIMQELIFDPAGMVSAAGENRQANLKQLPRFYNAEAGYFSETLSVDLSNKYAGGGLIATSGVIEKASPDLTNTVLIVSTLA